MKTRIVLGTVLLSLFAAAANAQQIAIQRIADASSPGMGWAEPVSFGAPSAHAGRVAFSANALLVPVQGAYVAHEGRIDVVADTSTPLPGGSGAFGIFFAGTSVSGDNVAFGAFDSSGFPGVYARVGGNLVTIADAATPEPGGGAPLGVEHLRGMSLDGDNVAFLASDGGGFRGAYASLAGNLVIAADENTPLPGGSGLTFLRRFAPAIEGTSVAFAANDVVASGLYIATGGQVRAVFDDGTVLPGSTTPGGFLLGPPSFRGGTLGFAANSPERGGIYIDRNGQLDVVADDTTLIPGTTDPFGMFGLTEQTGWVAVDGTTTAFIGGPGFDYLGLYVRAGGVLRTVLTTNDTLDGKSITLIQIGPDAVDGDRIAFRVYFEDSTEAIYVATVAPAVPSLTSAARLALAAVLGLGATPRLRRTG